MLAREPFSRDFSYSWDVAYVGDVITSLTLGTAHRFPIKGVEKGTKTMKTLLIVLIVSLCAIGWRSPDIMQAIGMAFVKQDPATISIEDFAAKAAPSGQKPMTAAEFAELSKTDPHAYQKYINSFQVQERTEVDKLFNFLARGKYE